MKKFADTLRVSASDLACHLGCRHLTALEVAVAGGKLERPYYKSTTLEALFERGLQHEKSYVDHLRETGLDVVEIPEDVSPEEGFNLTREAMRKGADVITQGWLLNGRWYGRADVLRRIDRASDLG